MGNSNLVIGPRGLSEFSNKIRHVPALTLKYTLQKLQSALNQAKTQGVILDSEVSFVNKELYAILKDNLHKMGSKDEIIKLDNLQDEKSRDNDHEDFSEPVNKQPIVIDITPKKPEMKKPQEQFKIVDSDKPVSEPIEKPKIQTSEEKIDRQTIAKSETDGNLKEKKEEAPVVQVVGRFAIKKQTPKPVQQVQLESTKDEEVSKVEKDLREVVTDSRGCQTDHEDHEDQNQVTHRSSEDQRKEPGPNIIEFKVSIMVYSIFHISCDLYDINMKLQ